MKLYSQHTKLHATVDCLSFTEKRLVDKFVEKEINLHLYRSQIGQVL